LQDGWADDYPTEALAPSMGMNFGFGWLFRNRRRRRVGRDLSESVHPSVAARAAQAPPRFRRLRALRFGGEG
jgi:hypothetical protein